MSEMLITCIFFGILSLLLFITGICSICFEDIGLGVISIFLSVVFAVVTIFCGDVYFKNQQFVYCPNCHYQYQVYEQYDYCPECNTKLTNKCDNCNKYLPDSATDTCPYCGETIKTKIGEIPESKKYSDEKQQYSKCPNCDKSLKDMKNIEQCPCCNFKLNQVVTSKANECPECHHSFEGMDYIKDICPYCGKEIEFKVGDIPNDSN
mgnify:FL=1